MCGICGEIGFDGRAANMPAVTMTHTLASRGPDRDARWTDGPVPVGQRRLAVIDVPAASRLDGKLLDDVVDVLRPPAAKARGLIDYGYVDALLADPDRRFAGRGDRLGHL